MAIEVLVVQHGEKDRRPGDPGLTAEGRTQARRVAVWLREQHDVTAVWASPLRRAQQTAAPIADALGLRVRTDARLRERMNWDGEAVIALEDFVAEWQRATADRFYVPVVGDSSAAAGRRFLDALVSIGAAERGPAVVVVAHGGVTIDALRTLVGDRAVTDHGPGLVSHGVPCGAITRLRVDGAHVAVTALPSTAHLVLTTARPPGPHVG